MALRICKDYGGGNQLLLLLRCYCTPADSLIHFANRQRNGTNTHGWQCRLSHLMLLMTFFSLLSVCLPLFAIDKKSTVTNAARESLNPARLHST